MIRINVFSFFYLVSKECRVSMEMAKVSCACVAAIDSGVCSAVSRALGIRRSHNLISQSRYWMVESCTVVGLMNTSTKREAQEAGVS